MGNTIGEKQVLESPTSNGMGTEIPEQLFGEVTRAQHKKTDWAIDNGRDDRRKESLDQEGPEEYVAKSTSTALRSSQGQQKHPEVQWKHFR